MTKNPSDERVIDPSPTGALCWALDVLLAALCVGSPCSLLVELVVNPLVGLALALASSFKIPALVFGALIALYRIKKRKGECWPIWRGTYCCWRGERPWHYVAVREE